MTVKVERDTYAGEHQQRVADLACAIAEKMGLAQEQIRAVRTAAVVHDIGKIYTPAEILNKPARLTKSEMEMVQSHPQMGYDILDAVKSPSAVAQIVLQHHERMDGSGYPQGLPGQEILVGARILGVADVVAAMASHRPYRPAHSLDEALEEIAKNRGSLYDSDVVDACLKVFDERRLAPVLRDD